MDSTATSLKKERNAINEFYDNLYREDNSIIKKYALEYSKGDKDIAKVFIDGYLHSIKEPHTRTIRLIELYVQDYIVPRYKKNPSDEHIVSCIRDIFRRKLYPKGLFEESEEE